MAHNRQLFYQYFAENTWQSPLPYNIRVTHIDYKLASINIEFTKVDGITCIYELSLIISTNLNEDGGNLVEAKHGLRSEVIYIT